MKKLLMSLAAGAFLFTAMPAKAETIAYIPGVLYVGVHQVRHAPPPPQRVVYVPVREKIHYAPGYYHRHGYYHPKYVAYKKQGNRHHYKRNRHDHR